MPKKVKILRVTTVASTMNVILKGQLSYLNEYFEIIGATAPYHNYFDEIKEREGIKLHKVNFTRKLTPIKDLVALFTLILIVLKEKPNIIHTQTPKANLLGMIAGFVCSIEVRMLSIVGMPPYKENGTKGKILKLLDLMSYKLATHIYPNSKGLYNFYTEYPVVKRKIGFIGNGSSNGVDFNFYNPNEISVEFLSRLRIDLGLAQECFVFSFMGRVVNDKGINELIDAFLSFCDLTEFSESRLLIIGPLRETDDPIHDKYQNLLNNHPKILYVGLQRDVRPYLLLSNVFVFPSHREGLPGSLMQAGALELPIIASDIIGNKEIIEQTDGLLFPVKDVEKLASAMKKIYKNQHLIKLIKKEIRFKMCLLYDQQKYWIELKNEYLKNLKKL